MIRILILNRFEHIEIMSENPLFAELLPQVDMFIVIMISTFMIANYIMIHQLFGPYVERKVMARQQGRRGPTYVGWKGILQIPADLLKLLFKEDLRPASADKLGFFVSILLISVTSILSFAPLPWGTNFVGGNLGIGVLFVFAVFSIFPPAMFIGGWAGNSKYALIGGFRSAGQLLAYEIPMFISAFTVIIVNGSFSLIVITETQIQTGWYFFQWWGLGAVAGFIFFISGIAETERIPFDIPEAEAELVMGPRTEFSGWRYALIMMVEYLHLTVNSLLFIYLFFGGYDPIPIPSDWTNAFDGIRYYNIGGFYIIQFIALTVKLYLFIFVATWFRSALPRMRIDQLLNLGWKKLLPVSIFTTAGVIFIDSPELYGVPWSNTFVNVFVGFILITLFILVGLRKSTSKVQEEEI
jgi:NAD(P)H-quinone oxidoreductase subunit 1